MTGDALAGPRARPCSTCPYRRDVPSGLWSAEEYNRLPAYDGDTAEQAYAGAFHLFFCHKQTGDLCAGWVGCHDMTENLAVRVNDHRVDLDAVLGYVSPVELFESGAQAAEHGKRDIADPGPAARRRIDQLLRQRDRRTKSGDVTPP